MKLASSTTRPSLERLEDRTLMSTCHVTRLTDQGIGKGFRGDLRYCINKVNAEPGADAIDFNVTGNINLQSTLPTLSSEIAVQGPGADVLTVRRDSSSPFRILNVAPAAVVSISGLTMANGRVQNSTTGGIKNEGQLTLTDSRVVGHSSESSSPVGTSAGGIHNAAGASLTLIRTTVESNVVLHTYEGYGGQAYGGGIVNAGTLEIFSSTIANNRAQSNSVDAQAFGGGIYNTGTLTVDSSTIHANIAEMPSAWGFNDVGGGGIYSSGVGSSVTIINSTITGNQSISGDLAFGGGIYAPFNGVVSIRNSTIVGNSASADYEDYGGGIYQSTATIAIKNSIIGGNSAEFGADLKGSFTSFGNNLFSNSSGGSGYAPTDILNVDPQLGPLADNGGPTLTMALLPSSPAIDTGDNTNALEWDQRGPGFPRMVNGTVDIGAFEVQSTHAPSLSRPLWELSMAMLMSLDDSD